MKHLRLAIRALSFSVVTGTLYGLFLVGSVLLISHRQASRRWRNRVVRTWARSAAVILGLKIRVRGTPPKAPFFLVSNHLSYIDIIVFASLVDSVFIAKHDVADWPIFGALSRAIDTIFIDRNRRSDVVRVNALIRKALAERVSLTLFPEGTSTQGSTVLPFKSSLLEPAVEAGVPVSYAAIRYRTSGGQPPAHLAVCWWGEMGFLSHLFALLQIPSFEAVVMFGSRTFEKPDRKALAAELWQAVTEQFIPIVKQEEECNPTTGNQRAA
ncbi:MAG TPA: lysophospholipid acyltransferase family protein [Blastocatellia bacterium]|nr:lysophospholipid acyltransferase family protein [Blastocatellia bacterium]